LELVLLMSLWASGYHALSLADDRYMVGNTSKEPLRKAVRKSMVGRLPGWRVEAGEPKGSALGGAAEVAG